MRSLTSATSLQGVILTPPAPDQVEVSVFGPGVGECVVIHLGNGEWMVVDSCVRTGSKTPIAVEYLRNLGLNVAQSVKSVVATHWHDDHVKGISSLLREATNARFYAAGVFRRDEFLAVSQRRHVASKFTSGVEELASVRAIIAERKAAGGGALETVTAVNRISASPDRAVREIWALSPSAEDAERGFEHIASIIDSVAGKAARLPSLPPNDVSVVLHLETPVGGILLGGDLEHHPSTRARGWHAVLDHPGRPIGASTFYKIPHHGSENADCPEIWQHLLKSQPICVLTPFERGKTPLPRPSDIERLQTRVDKIFVTSTRRYAAARRDRAVDKVINEAIRSFRPNNLQMGHIQARVVDDEWIVRGNDAAAVL
ncbi:MBL fold metallo-hydrolase [Streptomyces sp. NPDC002763]|uniref:MBL fold metallo-hydrolase n=1 Tax=Streptomyces sp. NPDC002763 TaxID=3154427 RepID=UPI0033301D76